MRSLLLVALLVGIAFASTTKYEVLKYNSQAYREAIVLTSDGLTRFTILTPRMIRMELTTSAFKFEDRLSIAFLNRALSVPPFSFSESDGLLTIKTSELILTYTVGNLNFDAESIDVRSLNSSSAFHRWDGGMRSSDDAGNLLGTFRTLDGTENVPLNCTLNKKDHCEFGLISRSGWALIDDSNTPVLDDDDFWADASGKPYERVSRVDLYLLAHGWDYKGALYDYTQVAGRIPIFPRYGSGIWYTRWYDYNNADTRNEVNNYLTRGLPLDVWVYDMNFHKKNDWSGYTFDPNLFPFPEDTLEFLHRNGLRISANLHDASGINNWEETYADFCKALGVDPATTTKVDFTLMNKTYVNALEDVVLGALEKKGLDFWWIDWQQGETGGHTPGGKFNPTILLDKIRVTDPQRRGSNLRGMVLARFGGLGNHRYQVGFSGDVAELTWANLAYQPYFSATASNVAFGFWSHDIEGPGTDHELYTRWLQWGAWSGIMRSHERGMSAGECKNPFPTRDDDETRCAIVEIWNTPHAYYEPMRAALLDRARLIPYIYTATREAFETGISIIRPLYYDYPAHDNAYLAKAEGGINEYMFGPDMLVAPVVIPSDKTTMANVTFWLPPGEWVERETGALRSGDVFFSKYVDISEVPVFVKAGAVIATIPIVVGDSLGTAARQYTTLEFSIYPGADEGSTRVYEDDGITTDYIDGAYAFTTLQYKRDSLSLSATVSTTGAFPELPTTRKYTLKIVNALPPKDVQVNGKSLVFSRWGGANSWHFCGDSMAVIIEADAVLTKDVTTFQILFSDHVTPSTLSGARGLVQHAILAKRNLDETRVTPGSTTPIPAYPSMLASSGDALAFLAGNNVAEFLDRVGNLSSLAQQALLEVDDLMPPPAGALLQLHSTSRHDFVLCGTEECRGSQSGYDRVRVEGYQPPSTAEGAVKLNDYWDGVHTDNWATTDTNIPTGYIAASFADGYVLNKQVADSIPLYCFYSGATGDHMTTASDDGIAYAAANGYSPCNGTKEKSIVGYVYTKPHQSLQVDPNRVAYSIALLEAALQ